MPFNNIESGSIPEGTKGVNQFPIPLVQRSGEERKR